MFYPQLVAGPIERPQNLLHQFHEQQRFDYDDVIDGPADDVGLLQEIVIADRLAAAVNPVYAQPLRIAASPCCSRTSSSPSRSYADFSGYSDIALGAARVMGFRLMPNFNRPYARKESSRSSGGAGTSRSPPGSTTTSTSRSRSHGAIGTRSVSCSPSV